ncbi:hypothetical protein cypCar_00040757, partial [Cyprinus carpio]
LRISSRNINEKDKTLIFALRGFFSDGEDGVSLSLMEGDSVIFQTGVETNQQGTIKWYYNEKRIAQINGDRSRICTDVQCNNGTESFRNRLKIDQVTGSLTIKNIKTTDTGVYRLKISSRNINEKDKTLIFALRAEISGDQSKICTDVQCDERFRDRLELDHQTGSLNIMNTRTTDSGDYKLLINSSRVSIIRSFSVTVYGKKVLYQ